MVKIAICGENRKETERTYSFVEEYRQSRPEIVILAEKFGDGLSLVESLERSGGYDIYILNTAVLRLDGIQLGEAIGKRNAEAQMILQIGASEQTFDDWYGFSKDYILRSGDRDRLYASLDRIIGELQLPKPKYFVIKTADGVRATAYQSILYVEYYNHRLTLYLTNGETVESLSLRGACAVLTDELLSDGGFLRISASHVVNMRYVRSFTSRAFEMMNGKKLNLSRVYSNARTKYMEYVMK